MHRIALLSIPTLVALALGVPAAAGPLAPARASDLVTVVTKNATPCTIAGVAFDTRVLPDGTQVPFEIPAGRVLVVTSLDFVAGAAPIAGQTATVVLTQQAGSISSLLQGSAVTDSAGTYAGSVDAGPGIAVRAGPTLCLIGGNSQSGLVHGFFAKDK